MTTWWLYPNCGTCKKALKFIKEKNIQHQVANIVETPPTKQELQRMLQYVGGNIRRLFNVSGELYRSMNIKDRLPTMTEKEALGLLANNGKLIKRPFILGSHSGVVGFDEPTLSAFLEKEMQAEKL